MKKITYISVVLLAILTTAYFLKNDTPIADPADYEKYLTGDFLNEKIEAGENEIDFWKTKLEGSQNNFVYQKKLAGLYAKQFKLTGNPQYLTESDNLLKNINQRIPNQVGILQSLATNAITQHEFRAAEQYITEALALGEKKFISSLILIDVLLERGKTFDARHFLLDVASDSHFDYLIRDVKYQDAKGDLAKAIDQMEKALDKALASGNTDLINWAYSNLGDMYGHNGEIKKSYRTFLKALKQNPADMHSLKGIAWIAFSHDKNTLEAKRVLNKLQAIHPVPDYDLLLADIAIYESDQMAAEQHQQAFLQKANLPEYGNMYKAYICELQSDTPDALAIAKAEVDERPHPMSYDLLAWSLFQNGDLKTAVQILENNVLHKTGEPVAIYHAGVILKEAGKYEEAEAYLKEAKDAAFELGPVVAKEVAQHLEELNRKQLAIYHIQNVKDYRRLR